MAQIVIVGSVCRDLVVTVDNLPGSGATPVTTRLEMLGGAANQAVAARQLGWSAGIIGAVGDDPAASFVLEQARRDGIDVSGVAHRPGGTTALVVDVVEGDGTARLLEHLPPETWLRAADVRAAAALIESAEAVIVEMRQPTDAVREAVRRADAGALVVVDGAPREPDLLPEILPKVDVIRADTDEKEGLVGRPLGDVPDTIAAARELVDAGARVVVLGVGEAGNVVVWPGGHKLYSVLDKHPVDPTGAGDALVVALVTALLLGEQVETAGWWAAAAAALAVSRLSGRPQLTRDAVSGLARRAADG